jgi:membrane protease YdiL (CAAX protease family)
MNTSQQTEAFDRRFLACLAVLLIVLVMAYLFAVTFAPMASAGGKYADIAVPLLLGTVIGGLVGFFYGASKNQAAPKPDPVPEVVTLVEPPKEPAA